MPSLYQVSVFPMFAMLSLLLGLSSSYILFMNVTNKQNQYLKEWQSAEVFSLYKNLKIGFNLHTVQFYFNQQMVNNYDDMLLLVTPAQLQKYGLHVEYNVLTPDLEQSPILLKTTASGTFEVTPDDPVNVAVEFNRNILENDLGEYYTAKLQVVFEGTTGKISMDLISQQNASLMLTSGIQECQYEGEQGSGIQKKMNFI